MQTEDVHTRLYKSKDSMTMISEFLPVNFLMELNLINQTFYNEVVPYVMKNRELFC